MAFKILLWSFWYNKHTCIFKIGEEKSGTGNAVLMQFCGHFGLQDGRRASKIFFFTIFQLSSSRPFIWYQICTENPVFRQKVSKPPYLPLTKRDDIWNMWTYGIITILVKINIDYWYIFGGYSFYLHLSAFDMSRKTDLAQSHTWAEHTICKIGH